MENNDFDNILRDKMEGFNPKVNPAHVAKTKAFVMSKLVTKSVFATTAFWGATSGIAAIVIAGVFYFTQDTKNTNSQKEISIETSVKIGMAYTATAKTLPTSFEAAAASRGMVKNINKVYARMSGSGTAYVGPTSSKTVPVIVTQAESGELSEMVEIPVEGDWNGDACLWVTHSDPSPFMLQAMVLEIATGG